MMYAATCHCGAVKVTIPSKPDFVNDCDCTLCGTRGALWAYFALPDIIVTGETHIYRRADRDQPVVQVHFCGRCGCTTHWSPELHIPQDTGGANMRLFGADAMTGVEVRFPDGRAWQGEIPYAYRRGPVVWDNLV
jgi:hypothetical protein